MCGALLTAAYGTPSANSSPTRCTRASSGSKPRAASTSSGRPDWVAVCTSRKSIRVAGDDYPAELVKAKFLKLDSHHIEFVMDCLRDNTTKVRNIKQYLRAMLFNAPSTINSYYASLVAHDMAQPDWGRPPNT